jgi:hypothetical protein
MSYSYPTAICDEGELKALTAMFKNATAASAFCDKMSTRVGGVEEGLNTFFLTINGALVFVMHAGFAMVSSWGGGAGWLAALCAAAGRGGWLWCGVRRRSTRHATRGGGGARD